MYEFSYHKAESLDDALKQLGDSGDGKLLAGGMTLLPAMKQRLAAPDTLVDLGGLGALAGIEKHDNTIVIGAMTTIPISVLSPQMIFSSICLKPSWKNMK